jgi:hypothetical protein
MPLCCFETQSTLGGQGAYSLSHNRLHSVRTLLALMGGFIASQSMCKNQVSLKSITWLAFIIRTIKTTNKNVSVSFEHLVTPKLSLYNSSLHKLFRGCTLESNETTLSFLRTPEQRVLFKTVPEAGKCCFYISEIPVPSLGPST